MTVSNDITCITLCINIEMSEEQRENKLMRKSIYFIIQIVWSLLFSVVIWYLALKNANFDFYGNSDDTIMVVILVAGAVIYLILTIVQIIVGVKKVKEWRWWVCLISLAIAGVTAFIGVFVAAYGSELLNKAF